MKYLVLLLTIMICTTSFAQKVQKAVIKTEIDCDHCKECETCGQLFAKSMYKISGLKTYEIDAVKNEITVFYNSKKTDINSLRNSISKLGYRADEVPADPMAYASLDGCCKK